MAVKILQWQQAWMIGAEGNRPQPRPPLPSHRSGRQVLFESNGRSGPGQSHITIIHLPSNSSIPSPKANFSVFF